MKSSGAMRNERRLSRKKRAERAVATRAKKARERREAERERENYIAELEAKVGGEGKAEAHTLVGREDT
jgi:hypothetical protein